MQSSSPGLGNLAASAPSISSKSCRSSPADAVLSLRCRWTSYPTRLSSWSGTRLISPDFRGPFAFAYLRADYTQRCWSDAVQVQHYGVVAVPRAAGPGSEEDLNSDHGHVTSGILNQDIFCPIAIETQDLGSRSI